VPKTLLLGFAVLGALLVPTQAVAAPKPTPTTGIDFDFVSFTQYGPATFHVDDLRLQMVNADTACWYLTLPGDQSGRISTATASGSGWSRARTRPCTRSPSRAPAGRSR
jgi:hypothetical protein